MLKRDLQTAFIISLVISIALVPTLISTGLYNQLPLPAPLVLALFPVLTLVGMTVAEIIAKKFKILLQVAKFALVGVSNTTVDFGLLNLLILSTGITSGAGIIPMNTVSFSAAVLNSYFWNKRWVFGEGKRGKFATFLLVTLIGVSINTGIVYTVTNYVPPVGNISETLWINIAKVLATGISLFWNFTGYKLIVFKK